MRAASAGEPLDNASALAALLNTMRAGWRREHRRHEEASRILPELNGG